MILSAAALVLLLLAGNTVTAWLNIPVPGALIGLVLLLLALLLLGRVPKPMGKLTNHLLAHLMLLFIPAVVAIMTQVDRIAAEWLAFIAACFGATVITTVVTAATLRYMLKRQQRKP